ncbi:MAG: PRD domain-containing protein, partial [Actinomycetota bacterium]
FDPACDRRTRLGRVGGGQGGVDGGMATGGIEVVVSAPLDSRVIRIVRWLLDQPEPRSTADLAADLGLSQRIVRYRLGAAENYLRSWGAELEKRRGSGLLVVAEPDVRASILDDLRSRSEAPRVYAPEERSRLLIADLLWAFPGLVSLEELHNELGVSKTSARRDLQLCEPWLERNGLAVVRRPGRGVGVLGTERRVRQVMVQLLLESLPAGLLQASVRDDGEDLETLASRVPVGLRERLDELPLREVASAMRDTPLLQRLDAGTGESVFSLYVAVTLMRSMAGRPIELEAGLQRSVLEHPAADTVMDVIPRLDALSPDPLGPADVAAIAEYWLGLDTVQRASPIVTLDHSLVDALLSLAAERLHAALGDDPELQAGLAAHLERLTVRLRHGLPVHNPLLAEVRARYPDVHAVAHELGTLIEAELGESIAEDEVGFITMYLSGAMERARLRPRRRVLVVCPSGMATAWVLVSRIQAEFPEFDLVEVLSEEGYDALDHSDFDLVITTVELTETVAPVVVVSPLMSARDVREVGTHA